MKKTYIKILAMLIFTLAFQAIIPSSRAQSPQKMSYQAVVRNSSNQLVVNQMVGMRISILQGSESGTSVYTETQKPTTNANGLVTIEIGAGTTSDDFSAIDWANGPYYIKTETDPSADGGTNYTINGVSQLLSVPYALLAKNVEIDKVDDADADPTNEIQLLSKSGNTVTLSKGGGSVSVDDADADPTNEIQALSKSDNTVTLSKGGGSFTDAVDDADADPTNEIQSLTLDGTILSLDKGGGSVVIPGDNWGTQTAVLNTTLEGNGTTATPLKIAQQDAANGQVLKWNGETWNPGNDETGESGLILPYSKSIAYGDYAFSVTNTSNSAIKGISSAADAATYGVYGETSSSTGAGVYGLSPKYGVKGVSTADDGSGIYGIGTNIGVWADASNTSGLAYGVLASTWSTLGMGVCGEAISNTGTTWGVYGMANSPDGHGVHGRNNNNNGGVGVYGSAQKYAVWGEASSTTGYGVVGKATSSTGTTVGVYGQTYSSSGFAGYFEGRLAVTGRLGIGTVYPSYSLDVAGSAELNKGISGGALYCNGDETIWYNGTYFSWGYGGTYNYFRDNVTIGTSLSPGYTLVVNGTAAKTGGGSWSNTSDIRLKNLLGNYDKGLKEIMALQPVKFFYKEGNPRELASDEEQIGFVAQDVQKVFPEAVSEAKDGYLDFNMHAVNVAVVNAIKELKAENDKLKVENEQLYSRLSNLEKLMGVSALK
jgi:hypothetical protein